MSNATDKSVSDLRDVIVEEDERAVPLGEKMAMLAVAGIIGLAANWAATGTTALELSLIHI